MEYIIVGDTKEYNDCLIYVVMGGRKHAEEVLNKMLNHPDEHDKKQLEKYTNIRIKEIESKDAWWNDPFLAN